MRMTWPIHRSWCPDDDCGDAGDVGFLQNADSEPLDFQGLLQPALVFQLSHSALDKCLCLGVGLPFVSTAVVVLPRTKGFPFGID